MAERKSFSFGFSKKVNTKTLEKSKLQEDNDKASDQQPDFVTSLEDREVKGSSKPKETKQKEYVIPLISKNNWRKPAEKDEGRPDNNDRMEVDQAVQELIEDAAKQNVDWNERGKIDPNVSIPLIMKNKVPEGYETDDKLDVSLRPDEVDVDYEEVPIEHFGVAMLRGMGWKDGQGIGNGKEAVAPIEAKLRPKGLGLGADRRQADKLNSSKAGGDKCDDKDEELTLKIGAYCIIQKGPHQDRYGEIKGLDEDNARCMVKLAVSGLMITHSQYSLKLVDKKEYSKYSKYLNKSKVDKYKKDQEKKAEDHRSDQHKKDKRDKDEGRDRKDRERHHHRDEERRDRQREDRVNGRDEDETDRGSGRLHEGESHRKRERTRDQDYNSDSKKKKHREESSKSHHQSQNGSQHRSPAAMWISPQLRVRMVDDNYKKGKYFNTKVEVIDVLSPDNIVCRTDNGSVLEGLSQEMLETVIPKSEPSFVQLVAGKWKGQLAELMKRDKTNCMAVVQLLQDRDEVLKLSYDSICEFVGDINAEFDY
ncbi:G-patch domain and KOW motifs-containing protein-like [Argopecten irradians]|uniref:G-patch domain and KOW motifs-containing protein-like n=1 Tax=Argopecten irradians TaxID=31199 RepID=UPI0037142104